MGHEEPVKWMIFRLPTLIFTGEESKQKGSSYVAALKNLKCVNAPLCLEALPWVDILEE